jgi:hypothetical protein
MREKIREIVFDLEDPIQQARNLAFAIHIIASGDELRGEVGDAIATVVHLLMGELDEIKGAREKLQKLAREASPPTVKGRRRHALRIVDGVQPGDGGAA